ncbi:MAG: hypothetical protein RL322_555 [Pseudomonadota bacterium]
MALLFHSQVDDPLAWRDALIRLDPACDFRIWPHCGDVRQIEAALVWKPPQDLIDALPNLRLLINLGAGVDHLLSAPGLPPSIPIARIVDAEMNRMMAQYVLLATLRHHRNFGAFERAGRLRQWDYIHPRSAADRTVGVMGLGQLGSTAALELARQGFQVRGWSRSPKALPGVLTFQGEDSLHLFLSKTDILVILLPLTPETRKLIDGAALASMPRGACLINVGRGPLVDEQALIEALDSGQLSEATLDVFNVEPLPPEHPLWERPQVLITPHLASIALPESGAVQVLDNLKRLREGLPLLNLVDRKRGY